LKLDNPRQLALMHALVRFSHVAAANSFTTTELYPHLRDALGAAAASRYTLAKLRHSRRYRLLPQGYSICLVFPKLFERVYAPLTAGLLSPLRADVTLPSQRQSQLDRLYQRVVDDLDALIHAIGAKAA
jgi:hypothetical protein